MSRILFAAIFLLFAALKPADAATDAEMVQRYCVGMITEFTLPDDTRMDCVSKTHAIEVEFSEKWAEALGQSLHYALWTVFISESPNDFARWNRWIDGPRKPGIVMVCRKARDTCTDHTVHLMRIIEEFKLPMTLWDCDQDKDMTLEACQILIDSAWQDRP